MPRPPGLALWLAALLVALQLAAVLNPDIVEIDHEEMYNAAHAVRLAAGHLPEALALQYRPFCGGCTLDALLGAALFTILPPIWLVWKLVPVGLSAALLIATVSTLRARLGVAAGWMAGLLLLLPAASWLALSLVAWGNHYECAVIVAAAVLSVTGRLSGGRAVLLGLLLGGGVWVGLSAGFALPAAAVWLLGRLRRGEIAWSVLPATAAGVLLGLLPAGLFFLSTGQQPWAEIYGGGQTRLRLAHLPDQLPTLLHPRQLAGLLGAPQLPVAAGLFLSSGLLAAGMAIRSGPTLARACVVFLLSWAGVYLLSGFHIPRSPGIPAPAALRYFAPAYPLLVLLIASVAGQQWRLGARRVSVVLLAGPLLVGLLSRLSALQPPFPVPVAATMDAAGGDLFRHQARYLLTPAQHRQCEAPEDEAIHGHALGYAAGAATDAHGLSRLRAPDSAAGASFYEGAAIAFTDRTDPGGSGDLPALSRIGAAGWPDGRLGLRAALRARPDAVWLAELEGHDADSLRRLSAALQGTAVAWDAWWLVGTRWAQDTARGLLPAPIILPPIDPALRVPPSFAEGLGEGLGELWGPSTRVPCPAGLPVGWQEAFLAGYTRGAQRRWSVLTEYRGAGGRAVCIPPTSARR